MSINDINERLMNEFLSTEGSSLLTPQDHERIRSYVFLKDQLRCLLSLLLQRYVILNKYGFLSSKIQRTRENKPFLPFDPKYSREDERWNYNVSHHGDYVGIVCHDHLLVGTDIVDTSTRPSWVDNFLEFLEIYRKQLAIEEISTLLSIPESEQQYHYFFLIWALKEAYVKAVGVGIGIDLTKIRFVLFPSSSQLNQTVSCTEGSAVMFIEQEERVDWRFDYFSLDQSHVMSIARGPPSDGLPEYQTQAWGALQNKSTLSVGTQSHHSTIPESERILLRFDFLVSQLRNCRPEELS